jgi:hypothetical protein
MFDSYQTFFLIAVVTIMHFTTTYEWYATKSIYMPKINFGHEGWFFTQILILVTWYLGPETWLNEICGFDKRNLVITCFSIHGFISITSR